VGWVLLASLLALLTVSGFTALDRPDYEKLKANKQVINDGAYVQYLRPHGKLIENLRTAQRA
jgi:large subunit ribosomal protein L10e